MRKLILMLLLLASSTSYALDNTVTQHCYRLWSDVHCYVHDKKNDEIVVTEFNYNNLMQVIELRNKNFTIVSDSEYSAKKITATWLWVINDDKAFDVPAKCIRKVAGDAITGAITGGAAVGGVVAIATGANPGATVVGAVIGAIAGGVGAGLSASDGDSCN